MSKLIKRSACLIASILLGFVVLAVGFDTVSSLFTAIVVWVVLEKLSGFPQRLPTKMAVPLVDDEDLKSPLHNDGTARSLRFEDITELGQPTIFQRQIDHDRTLL